MDCWVCSEFGIVVGVLLYDKEYYYEIYNTLRTILLCTVLPSYSTNRMLLDAQ